MCVDALYRVNKNESYRCLFATPYENQVRLIFTRLKELIDSSPRIKERLVKSTSNPYQLVFTNGSMIVGFTTGAASGSGGASIRGQRADYIYMDEVDKTITFNIVIVYNYVGGVLNERNRSNDNWFYDRRWMDLC